MQIIRDHKIQINKSQIQHYKIIKPYDRLQMMGSIDYRKLFKIIYNKICSYKDIINNRMNPEVNYK